MPTKPKKNSEGIEGRIKEFKNEKEAAITFVSSAKNSVTTMVINGTMEIKTVQN